MKTINELGISYMPNTPGENPQDNHNEQNEDPKTQSKELGAKTLSQVGFNERNKKIVDSSFNKALKKGEKLSGKNGERRSFAYLFARLFRYRFRHRFGFGTFRRDRAFFYRAAFFNFALRAFGIRDLARFIRN